MIVIWLGEGCREVGRRLQGGWEKVAGRLGEGCREVGRRLQGGWEKVAGRLRLS
ncbi:hypothetical protein DPMN_159958 [Dreissena polymorpha]|uniref:Uncharacterized protein n=1 Tax=Dreissena polymorpha TaxID=45954 RepID=A0A9D4IR84_DREPO|nr:hypothetical protein DPMN_083694 [Dreissena polymorpha]KAH3782047.1 hypothetical protein DPMN_159958 [Dreissena polymorpha]